MEGIVYTLNDAQDGYIVTGYNGTEAEVVIASVYGGLPVVAIGDSAFALCTSLTNIRFGGTVAKWELIVKGMLWNSDVPATQTVCVDGSTAP